MNGIRATKWLFELYFGRGAVKGIVVKSFVHLGELVASIHFGLARDTSGLPKYINGVLGVGLPGESIFPPSFPLARPALDAFKIEMFSLFLSEYLKRETSLFMIGLPHASTYTGSITYETIHSPKASKWSITMDSIWIQNKELKLSVGLSESVIDSGTSYIVLPTSIVLELAARLNINDTVNMRVDCNLKTTGPPIKFKTASGRVFSIPSSSYVISLPSRNDCELAIESHSHPFIVLGATFLRQYVSVYDLPRKRIGFAEAVHNCPSGHCNSCQIC